MFSDADLTFKHSGRRRRQEVKQRCCAVELCVYTCSQQEDAERDGTAAELHMS